MDKEKMVKLLLSSVAKFNEYREDNPDVLVGLRGVNLAGANLKGANLTGADLTGANLTMANLRGAFLRKACLAGADLKGANLTGADLTGADLTGADLTGADLTGANLTGANPRWANLTGADLTGANLTGANLRKADLIGANLSNTKGLTNSSEYMRENFEKTRDGYVVYKRIGDTYFSVPNYWKIESGNFIEEVVNPCPADDCGCGVNFGTREWCNSNYPNADLWKCLLHWEDLATLVVPYNTDGKCRCGRLQLLEIIKKGE
ncbi:MAG: pentapeptide repeat-containing protein [Thermotogota bacterium]|nr:pentapeptide repeat-containing protein [Thermotogota bacterium]